jgi:hypothetical protein
VLGRGIRTAAGSGLQELLLPPLAAGREQVAIVQPVVATAPELVGVGDDAVAAQPAGRSGSCGCAATAASSAARDEIGSDWCEAAALRREAAGRERQ